jgi:hypothetical protein
MGCPSGELGPGTKKGEGENVRRLSLRCTKFLLAKAHRANLQIIFSSPFFSISDFLFLFILVSSLARRIGGLQYFEFIFSDQRLFF